MALPDFPVVDDAALAAIADRHGLPATGFTRLPQIGTFNEVYALGDVLLRLPRNAPRFVDAARNEAVAVPLAREAGVRTPAMLAFDDTMELLPVPYSLYERVPGRMLEGLVPDAALAAQVWTDLGRDLALLHAGVADTPRARALVEFDQKTDPRPLPEVIATAGYFGSADADWLGAWLDRLAPVALSAPKAVFLHGDSQSSNVIVDPQTVRYRAVIDWGGAGWGDVAVDFSGVPLRAVPAMLAGYRAVAATDDTLEGRIVWQHLTLGLHQLRGAPQPALTWGERPMGILLETLRFFVDPPDARWKAWGP